MHHSLYIAHDADAVPLAAVGIAVGPGSPSTTACRWVLLLPRRSSAPRLGELTGPSDAAQRMRTLALMQAACHARTKEHSVLPRDFHRAPWWTLQRWVLDRAADREAVAAMAAHLGNPEDFGWLGPWAAPGHQHAKEAHR